MVTSILLPPETMNKWLLEEFARFRQEVRELVVVLCRDWSLDPVWDIGTHFGGGWMEEVPEVVRGAAGGVGGV